MNIEINCTKISLKFFNSHQNIFEKFKKNLINYYINKDENIDIKKLKTYENLFRMRISSYRIIYELKNGEIKIINVLMAGARGDVYKKLK